jgi:hypothetical protein
MVEDTGLILSSQDEKNALENVLFVIIHSSRLCRDLRAAGRHDRADDCRCDCGFGFAMGWLR